MGTAQGAYATENNTIYLSKEFLEQNDSQRVAATIVEEIGHWIDAQINTQDSAGDEGQIFSRLVTGDTLTPSQLALLKVENDRAVITVDGQQLSVEQSVYFGTNGDDTIIGNDVYSGLINALDGNDTISIGPGGAYEVAGRNGDDLLIVDYSTINVDIYHQFNFSAVGTHNGFMNAAPNSVNFSEIERFNITGGLGNDMVIGGQNNDILIGGAGNDYLDGQGGTDTINGGDGIDALMLDLGASTTNTTVTLNTTTGSVLVSGTTFTSLITGIERFSSYTNGDGLTTGSGDDWITGGIYKDIIASGAGNDTINGGNGNDKLEGGNGNDTLDGGLGNDWLLGGLGNDIYVIDNANDIVQEDHILSDIDTVQSSINYSLDIAIENLTLTGITAIDCLGNDSNNILTGNAINNYLYGGAGDDILNGAAGADTMDGSLGNDTYIVDNVGDVITETYTLATEIDTVQSSVTYTISANVERLNLTGTTAINATGNELNNTLTGNTASNTLNGLAGADTMIGGTGNDIYTVDNIGDIVTEASTLATEIDTVQSSVTYTIGANLENLTLTGTGVINGTGNAFNNTLTGNGRNNTLNGAAGNDTLNGLAGVDTMIGGTGNDTYLVDNIGDIVTETSTLATEIDAVQSSVTYTIGANVEKLTLTGTAAINATGNALNNTLTGNSGNNTLNGLTGADTMIGGTGNDTYVVDNTADVVTETSTLATEIDTIQSSATYTIGANVEKLTLTGTAVINGTGNALNNTLTGNSGNNILNGLTGVDTMIGGTGNDTYIVDNTADIVTEISTLASEIDTIQSSVTYSLGANVEHLTLTGTAAINATGNALNNTLTGNSAANTLNGGDGIDYLIGGVGNDILDGGNGTDVYIIDADIHTGTDTINETATGGIDVLDFRRSAAAVTVDLSKTTDQTVATNVQLVIPVMTLEYVYGGTGNDTLTGNTLNNTLFGGAGNDTLKGGAGIDSFLFSGGALSGVTTVSSRLGNDTIADFVTGQDKILLSKTTFSAITSAAYTPIGTNFAMVANDGLVAGSSAAIVYSQASKNLFYNQNGAAVGYGDNGGSFATLTGVASVAAGDFTVVG